MTQVIINEEVMKAKDVTCPCCERSEFVELEYNNTEEGTTEFYCRHCEEVFELNDYEIEYDEYDDAWRDLTPDEAFMVTGDYRYLDQYKSGCFDVRGDDINEY